MEVPALADLLDLQAVDLHIDRLLDRRQNLPALEQYKAAHAERLAAEKERDRLADELRTVSLELDKAEGELEIFEQRLKETEMRLFAGGMNARETENKRLEVQQLKDKDSTMETLVIELLDRRESLEAQLGEAETTLSAAATVEGELESTISAAWKEIDLEIGRYEARKSEIAPSIPSDLLELYEKLRTTKEGVAVGALENGQCGGCHLTLSTSEQIDARDMDPPRCVHCRRILVM